MIHSISARYGAINSDGHDSLEQAKRLFAALEDDGECFLIGFFDDETKIAHLPNHDIVGQTKEGSKDERLEEFSKMGFLPEKIECYDQSK